ncbi:MAG: hypothetical protein C4576_01015 [Desulfobacteraceae bacterium]|nr:MAG: hypothetical protein C4576_01015 [Desulfobacteraceae bacterium]
MKTAISLPKDVFEKAERLAKRARKSRSQLYGNYFMLRSITESLNRVIEENGPPEQGLATLASAETNLMSRLRPSFFPRPIIRCSSST